MANSAAVKKNFIASARYTAWTDAVARRAPPYRRKPNQAKTTLGKMLTDQPQSKDRPCWAFTRATPPANRAKTDHNSSKRDNTGGRSMIVVRCCGFEVVRLNLNQIAPVYALSAVLAPLRDHVSVAAEHRPIGPPHYRDISAGLQPAWLFSGPRVQVLDGHPMSFYLMWASIPSSSSRLLYFSTSLPLPLALC